MSNIIASGQEKLLVLPAEGQPIEKASDANDLLAAAMAAGAAWVVIPTGRLGQEFLQLRTRIAGEFFQKFVTYRIGCAVIGDITDLVAASTALRDFVRETNKGRTILFAPDLDDLLVKLG